MTCNFVILDEKNLAINDPTKEETREENNKSLVVVEENKVKTIWFLLNVQPHDSSTEIWAFF